MNASINDPQVITAINPFDLASYLHAHGWRRGNAISEGRARMIEALQTLEAIEQRSQLEILADIQQASSEIIRSRIIQDDSSGGSILLEDGQLFIAQVRSQLLAAACAAAQPMQCFANRKPAAATEYMQAEASAAATSLRPSLRSLPPVPSMGPMTPSHPKTAQGSIRQT